MESPHEHLLARAQGVPQRPERRGDWCCSSLYAFTLADLPCKPGYVQRGEQCLIAFTDEDHSALSKELFNAFYPPRFKFPSDSVSEISERSTRDLSVRRIRDPPAFRTGFARRAQSAMQ